MAATELTGLYFFFFSFFWFFFSELGTEPRALPFLGKHSTTELNPQPLDYISKTKMQTVFLACGLLG